jgi:integrase
MKAKQEHVLPLAPVARAILDDMPNVGRHVFTTNGRRPINGFTKSRAELNAAVLAEMRKQDPGAKPLPNWTIHDLRRTARSLMSRAGVNADIAERVMAHTIGGIPGVYDRYAYIEEKRHALKALATMIERIVTPPADNVVPFEAKGIPQVPG